MSNLILPLEKQVTSLELSKELKELGAPQNTYLHWILDKELADADYIAEIGIPFNVNGDANSYAAYTAAELGVLLPESISFEKRTYYLSIKKDADLYENYIQMWLVKYVSNDNYNYYLTGWSDVLANAMSGMLINLLENKLLSFEGKGDE